MSFYLPQDLEEQKHRTEEKNRKSKGSLKKDQEVKKVKVEEGEDDATIILHPQRFSLRTPLKKPEDYWSLVPYKWPEVNKKIHLAHLGLDHVISAKTIEMVHDKSDTNIDIRKFSSVCNGLDLSQNGISTQLVIWILDPEIFLFFLGLGMDLGEG